MIFMSSSSSISSDSSGLILRSTVKVHLSGTTLKFDPPAAMIGSAPDRV